MEIKRIRYISPGDRLRYPSDVRTNEYIVCWHDPMDCMSSRWSSKSFCLKREAIAFARAKAKACVEGAPKPYIVLDNKQISYWRSDVVVEVADNQAPRFFEPVRYLDYLKCE